MTGNTRITGDPKVFGLIYFLGAVITSQGGFRTTEVYSFRILELDVQNQGVIRVIQASV